MSAFDPDALLAAMPRRQLRSIPIGVSIPRTQARASPLESSLGALKEYNGFTDRERNRTADLSNWLAKAGAVDRPKTCEICDAVAQHEHAENYYDLSTWVGMCVSCHVNALHKRFANPGKWLALLDRHERPSGHWSRLVAMKPFDMARHVRAKGQREPIRENFAS